MASTIVDGIDNGLVENVILFRGCYSVSRLVQTLGRIRPPRQNFDKATLDILDTGYNPVQSGDVETSKFTEIRAFDACLGSRGLALREGRAYGNSPTRLRGEHEGSGVRYTLHADCVPCRAVAHTVPLPSSPFGHM